jgi:putative protease
MKLPELLAPAANIECAEAAFVHGADAVYIGVGAFNLRARSRNASPDELASLLDYAKGIGKKVYGALNAMPDEKMLPGIESLLQQLCEKNILPHAFIVSDPGVILLCRRYAPGVALHLSTQTGTFNSRAAAFWKEQGICRIIVPRELSIDQIAALCGPAQTEIEVFVHGAMCVSVSGRCLLGMYTRRRHPNHGDCPQPCRLKYRISPLYDGTPESNDWFTVEEDEEEGPLQHSFVLNSKDLCALPLLDKIAAAGVASVKIEGRNRSRHYVSSVVKVYRAALDSLSQGAFREKKEWKDELDRLDHRPYTTGFYAGEYELQDTASNRPMPKIRIVGLVREILPGRGIIVDVKNPFCEGDMLNVLPVKKSMMPYDIKVLNITDLAGNILKRALTNNLVIVETGIDFAKGDIFRKGE